VAMSNISWSDLAAAITEELENYSEEVTTGVKNATEIVAKEVNEVIKNHIVFKQGTGKYVKAFRLKTAYEDKYNKGKIWYVANGQYRLTHLLEKGHVKKGGGRAKEFPHIIFGEELAQKRMEELAREAIEDAGH